MRSFLYQFVTDLQLYYRNRVALLYGYLFPTIFLVAFWVLYRHELVPLVNHMGELLTVTALGGACFGLPTAMVSDRERGVWRRYRVAPVSTLQLVLGTLAARYVILLSAAMLQLMLAMWIGMPLPEHLFDLWLAFTFVSFAFLGLGLVIAMLADNVPAVQALGQSIFLPMLIIGGVAVRIESLPAWAQHLSAFFPGRYSVDAIQVCVDGAGLGAARFSLLALLLVGAAGCLASAKMFRWDAQERFVSAGNRAWLGVALAAWIAVGLLAEATGRISPRRDGGAIVSQMDTRGEAGSPIDGLPPPRSRADSAGREAVPLDALPDSAAPLNEADADEETAAEGESADSAPDGAHPEQGGASHFAQEPPGEPPPESREEGQEEVQEGGLVDGEEGAPEGPVDEAAPEIAAGEEGRPQTEASDGSEDGAEPLPADPERSSEVPATWQEVTMQDVERHIRFDALPYDEGLEAPIAEEDDPVYPDIRHTMECILEALPEWPPAQVDDPVQRARNVLYVAAVPDMYQMSGLENWIPHAVFEHLRSTYPEAQLIQILYWIAMHQEEGSIAAADRLSSVCLAVGGPSDVAMLQERTGWYAAKLLGRITGHLDGG